MSGKIMGKVWDLDLPHNQLLILLALADHADHEGNNVYPSLGLVAWKTGYSEQQVRRVMRDLEKAGILKATERKPGKSARYRIDIEASIRSPGIRVRLDNMRSAARTLSSKLTIDQIDELIANLIDIRGRS